MVLQLDPLDGLENLQPEWANHLPVIRRYAAPIERWRSEVEAQMPATLRRRPDAAQLVDKFLWTMAGENSAGDPTIFHDGGNGYGLMADRVSRTPPGSAPGIQIRNAWNLVANNPLKWTDWGEGTTWFNPKTQREENFGALGVIAPYDPDPNVRHKSSNPDNGQVSQISPPNVGDEGLASATTMPQGWEPPAGYTSDTSVPMTEKLRIAREKRLRDSGVIPEGAPGGAVVGGILQNEEQYPTPAKQPRWRSILDTGLSAATDVYNSAAGAAEAISPTSIYENRGRILETGGDALSAAYDAVAGGPYALSGGRIGMEPRENDPSQAYLRDVVRPAVGDVGAFIAGGPNRLSGGRVGMENPGAENIGRVVAEGTVPTDYAEFLMALGGAKLSKGPIEAITGLPVDDLARAGPKVASMYVDNAVAQANRAYDESAVRLAANQTFDRLAPPSLLRHERAGAAIAQEAAGLPVDPRSPFARPAAAAGSGFGPSPSPITYVDEFRQGGARTGREMGPEVAGGSAGVRGRNQQVRKQFVESMGEDAAKNFEGRLKAQGLTWADWGDLTGNMANATPSWERAPSSSSVRQGSRAVDAQGNIDYDVLRSEIRQSVNDVRAERAGGGARSQMEQAQQRLRGARAGREAGPEVGGGRAVVGGIEGAPPGVVSPEDVANLRSKVAAMAASPEGTEGRFWYEGVGEAFLRVAQHDVDKATKLAWYAAMGSPQTVVQAQGAQIMKAVGQVLRGDPVAVHTATQNARINRILNGSPEALDQYVVDLLKAPVASDAQRRALLAAGESPDRGRKTANFFLDMLDHIDPERAARIRAASGRSGATIDMHMARAFGYPKDAVTDKEYSFIENTVLEVADQLGWTPSQVQAGIFTADIYNDPTRLVSVEQAAMSYARALDENRAIISWESGPGKGTPASSKLPNYESWSYAEQVEFHADVEKVFLDDNGDNILAKALGIPGGMIHRGPGIYEGQVHPGAAFDIYLHRNMYDQIDQMAALTGYVNQQTAVPWTRPVYDLRTAAHNGLVLDMGRPMTPEEAMALSANLGNDFVVVQGPENDIYAFKIPNDLDFLGRDLPVADERYKLMGETNKAARQKILDTIDEVWDNSLEVRHTPMATEGNYLENDWTVSPNGEAYLSAAPASQSPDVRATLAALRSRFQAVVDTHALKHADDPPIGARDPRFDYSQLQPVTGLVARQRDITRTRGAAWIDPQGQIWLNNAPEHVDAIVGGRGMGTQNAFGTVMPDGWVRVVSTKNPDSPIRELNIQGMGEAQTRAGVETLLDSLPESARETTRLMIVSDPVGADYWMGTADEWLEAGKPVAQPDPFGRTPAATSFDSNRPAAARLEGARQGREFGANVGGGSAGVPPERPRTTWNVTNAAGETRQVETRAGPVSSSPEEARARLARNTEAQDRLNAGMATDRRVGRAQQAAEGIQQLREQGRIVRVAVRDDAMTPLDPDSLVGSRGATELTDPAGARVLGPNEQPGPGETLMYHGAPPGGVQGDLRPGTNLTPNEGDAAVFARTSERLEQTGDVPEGIQRLRDAGINTRPIAGAEVLNVAGRDVVVVEMPDGSLQPFYKSSGTSVSSGGTKTAGEWQPFQGFGEVQSGRFPRGWFIKGGNLREGAFRDVVRQLDEALPEASNAAQSVDIAQFNREVFGQQFDTPEAVLKQLDTAIKASNASPQDVRRAGARQGRMFGGDVSGGSALPAGTTAPTPAPANNPVGEAVRGLGRELLSTPGAALSTVASYSPQIGRQGLPAFFMNPTRTLRNLARSMKAGVNNAEGERLLEATLADDWVKLSDTTAADNAAQAAYRARYEKAGPVARSNMKPPAATPKAFNAGYTWQDVGGTILDWRGTSPLEGKTLTELQAIADQHNINLPKNVTAARAREQIARDLRPELLEGLSQETRIGRAAEAVTRPSSRQAATELNLYRTDWYRGAAQAMWDAGERNVEEYEKLRKTIEIFTQRGAWKQPFSFPAFFSTRAMSARVQMIERGLDAMIHFPDMFKPGARQEAAKALLATTAGNLTMMAGLYGAADAAGLNPQIEMDGKLPTLTVGDRFHFDPWAGVNTPARAIFGVVADTLAAESPADAPQAAIASATTRGQRILRGGLSPVLGKVADAATGRDYTGQKYSLKDDITSGGFARDLLAPMIATSVAEGYAEGGPAGAVATGVPSSVSLSVNAYQGPKDVANETSRNKYGREFDDLTKDERVGILANLPERERKTLAKEERKSYQSDLKAAGYQDYWKPERKAQFFEEHPELEVRAWFHDDRTLRSSDSVDKILALDIPPEKSVRYRGSSVNINRDEQTREAWRDSGELLRWYQQDLVDQKREDTARRMYKKAWKDLEDTQRSSVIGNIHDLARKNDPELGAWLWWWGSVEKTQNARETAIANQIIQRYGPGKSIIPLGQVFAEEFQRR